MQPLVIEPSRGLRWFAVGMVAAVIVVLLVMLSGVVVHLQHSAVVVAILLALWVSYYGYRVFTLSLQARGQELVVRNRFSTRRVRVSEVRGVSVVQGSRAGQQLLVLDTARGAIPVHITVVPGSLSPPASQLARERLERRRSDIERWLAGAREAGGVMPPAGPGPSV